MTHAADAILAVPPGTDYTQHATAHVRELIHRYRPSVLWNDVCWPAGGDLAAIFADYYDTVPDGVINDRWLEPTGHRGRVSDAVTRGLGNVVQALWHHLPEDAKSLTFPSAHHFDFTTPEYATFEEIPEKKREATRGVGHSFGANRNERPEDIVTTTELVRMFCDVVAKNGNLLIGIGPDDRGRIPDQQADPLRGLGDWLTVNGAAIYGTRPWLRPAGETTEGTRVRYTQRDGEVFALLVDTPGRRRVGLRGIAPIRGQARLLGDGDVALPIGERDGQVEVTLPERLPVSAAHVLSLGTGVTQSG